MIGGHGMADAMCAPQYGFVYLDTTSDRIRLFYFEIGDLDTMFCNTNAVDFPFTVLTVQVRFVFLSIHYDKRMMKLKRSLFCCQSVCTSITHLHIVLNNMSMSINSHSSLELLEF